MKSSPTGLAESTLPHTQESRPDISNPTSTNEAPEATVNSLASQPGAKRSHTARRWTRPEQEVAMQHVLDVDAEHMLFSEQKPEEVSRRLKAQGFNRSPSAVANLIGRIRSVSDTPSRRKRTDEGPTDLHQDKDEGKAKRQNPNKGAKFVKLVVANDDSGARKYKIVDVRARNPETVLASASTTSSLQVETPYDKVKFMFHHHGGLQRAVPRERLYSRCDTLSKLFEQAVAGNVFTDLQSIRVLACQVGGMRKVLIARDDQEDYNELLAALLIEGQAGRAREDAVVHVSAAE